MSGSAARASFPPGGRKTEDLFKTILPLVSIFLCAPLRKRCDLLGRHFLILTFPSLYTFDYRGILGGGSSIILSAKERPPGVQWASSSSASPCIRSRFEHFVFGWFLAVRLSLLRWEYPMFLGAGAKLSCVGIELPSASGLERLPTFRLIKTMGSVCGGVRGKIRRFPCTCSLYFCSFGPVSLSAATTVHSA